MAVVFGSTATLSLFDEGTYGTPGTNGYKVYFTSESLKVSQQSFDTQTITGNREKLAPVRGNKNVSGTISVELSPENTPLLLFYAIGGTIDTSEITPSTTPKTYIHTLTGGNALNSFTAEVNFGTGAPTDYKVVKYKGLKVNSMGVQIPNNGNVTASFDCVGQDVSYSTSETDSYLHTTTFSRFSSFDTAVIFDTVASTVVESFSFSVANELDESVFPIHTDGKRTELPTGFQTITGQMTVFFSSDASGGILDAIKNGTKLAIKVVCKKGNGD